MYRKTSNSDRVRTKESTTSEVGYSDKDTQVRVYMCPYVYVSSWIKQLNTCVDRIRSEEGSSMCISHESFINSLLTFVNTNYRSSDTVLGDLLGVLPSSP